MAQYDLSAAGIADFQAGAANGSRWSPIQYSGIVSVIHINQVYATIRSELKKQEFKFPADCRPKPAIQRVSN